MDGFELEKAELDALERVVGDPTAEPMVLSFWLLKHITNDFSEETLIGEGGFAKVYLGRLPNGSRIAVKRMSQTFTIPESVFHNEVDMMIRCAQAAHKNIVRLIGYCAHMDVQRVPYEGKFVWADLREWLICLEYVPNGTLDKRITDIFHGLDWNQRYQILKGICRALSYLHDEVRVIHGDIKPGNVLLEDSFEPKLYDFGLSMGLDEGADCIITENITGSMGYIAPEIYRGRFSFKTDIYALGVVIAELLTGSMGYPDVEQVLATMSEEALVKYEAFSSWENKYQQVKKCLEIACNCMEMDADKRPTASEIIQLLDKIENTKHYVVGSGHARPLWQSGNEELDLSDTCTIEKEQVSEPESTDEFPPCDQEPVHLNTNEETNMQEDDKSGLVSEFPTSADLFDLKFLEKITDGFSLEKLVGNDGTFGVFRKAFVYKGTISGRPVIAVKRLIGVGTKVTKFEREAKKLMSLDHKNIVKLLGYCHDESREHKLVQYKGKEIPEDRGKEPEQLLCYEYMHNGNLHEYLSGHQELDWPMRYDLIKGTCEGLYYLHEGLRDCRIVHLNLTPTNVLLDKNYVPHITGFDISRLIGQNRTNSVLFDLKGQIRYLPRDFLNPMGTGTDLAPVDIYSLGLMILEIVTRQEIDEQETFIKSVLDNWREEPKIASQYPSLEPEKLWQVKLCIEIGLDCVKSKPEQRPTAGAIIDCLDKGSRPELITDPRPGLPRPPVCTNVTQADDCTQGKEKPTGLKKLFRRK